MNNYLLMSYKSILLLAGLCYTFNSFAQESEVKYYDNMPTKEQLLEDLMPPSAVEPELAPRIRSSRPIPQPEPETSTRSTNPCTDPNFKPKSVAISIQFELNSYTLTKEAKEFADLLGEVLSADELRDCDFEIEGHTDSSGSRKFNQKLSRQRAETVKKYLINQHSINPAHLKAIGYGENRLLTGIYSTSPKHRRVQVKNVGRF